jgi:putative endonuclease
MERGGCIYFMTNKNKTTIYIGVTSNLLNRVNEHKTHKYQNSFTDKYNLEYLIFYELHSTIEDAIAREKQVKKWNRQKKDNLINSMNPNWVDLWDEIIKW